MKPRFKYPQWLVPAVSVASLILILGCRPSHPLTDNEVFEENFSSVAKQFSVPPEDVTTGALDNIPSYFGLLKTGMTPAEVFRTLHLPKVRLTGGDHRPRDYTLDFQLRTNRSMVLRFNMLSNPPCFLGGVLAGDGWKRQSPTNGLSP